MASSFAVTTEKAASTRSSSGRVALAGRVLLASLFLPSGIMKIAQPVATLVHIQSAGLPFPPAALALSALVEIGGSLALIVGYRSRFAAAVLAIFSIIAALFFHSNFQDQNQMIHFFKNVAIAGGLLQVAAFGAGRLSLDSRRMR